MEDAYYYIDENNVKHVLELEDALSIEIFKKRDIHFISYSTYYIYCNNVTNLKIPSTIKGIYNVPHNCAIDNLNEIIEHCNIYYDENN